MESKRYLPSFKIDSHLAKERGFSLLEMLIASMLGLVLTNFFIILYLSVKHTTEIQKNWSDIQQKGRFAVYFFNEILAKAGLNDCERSSTSFSAFQVVGTAEKNHDAITVYHCISMNSFDSFLPIHYFIENNKLYFKPKLKSHAKRLLLEGVETMKIEYGISCQHRKAICHYLPANRINEWQTVKSVSIEMHLTSGLLKKKWYVYVALPQKAVS